MEGFVRPTKCILITNFEQVMRRDSTQDDFTCDAFVNTSSFILKELEIYVTICSKIHTLIFIIAVILHQPRRSCGDKNKGKTIAVQFCI
jgi:hypothetical protein